MTFRKKVIRRKSKPSEYYVDNTKFLEEIKKYKVRVKEAEEKGLEKPRITEYLGECIQKIAEKLSYSPEFINYTYKQEMISDGIENCIMYFDNFDPDKNPENFRSGKISPFNYFTQIIYFSFQRRITKEEKQRYIKYKYLQENIIGNHDFAELDGFDPLQNQKMYENIDIFMQKFEEREARKKEKRDAKKASVDPIEE